MVNDYEINDMIIDDEFTGEENVTAAFTHKNKGYSITFNKADLEVINAWMFEKDKTLPANLTEDMIEAIREDVKKYI